MTPIAFPAPHPVVLTLRRIRRPRTLLRTARFGLQDYDRARDLKRILGLPEAPPPGLETFAALIALEAEQEARRTRAPSCPGAPWRAAQHVEILIALLAEARAIVALTSAEVRAESTQEPRQEPKREPEDPGMTPRFGLPKGSSATGSTRG